MKAKKTIKLPLGNIEITLIGRDKESQHSDLEKWLGGSITSDLKEVCEYCNDAGCEMNCTKFLTCEPTEKEIEEYDQERIDFNRLRIAADTLESLILAHAIAGIDVEHPAYFEGLYTVQNALMNNL